MVKLRPRAGLPSSFRCYGYGQRLQQDSKLICLLPMLRDRPQDKIVSRASATERGCRDDAN
jgi:hypothetical protein